MKKYEYVYKQLTNRIKTDCYPSSKLPAEKELEKEFNCSRQTIKTAMELLLHDGVIYRRKGKGTFVREDLFKGATAPNKRYLSREEDGSTRNVVEFKIRLCNGNERRKLGLKIEEYIYAFKRIRYIDNSPEVVEYTIIPLRFVPNLTEDTLSGSLLTFLNDNLKEKIDSVQKRFIITQPTVEDLRILNLEASDCVVKSEEVIVSVSNQIIAYGDIYYSPRKFEYYSVVSRVRT